MALAELALWSNQEVEEFVLIFQVRSKPKALKAVFEMEFRSEKDTNNRYKTNDSTSIVCNFFVSGKAPKNDWKQGHYQICETSYLINFEAVDVKNQRKF